MKQFSKNPLLAFGLLLLGLGLILTAGCLKNQADFLTRGIPKTLPEPILGGGATLGLNVSLSQYDDRELNEQLSQISDLGIQQLKQTFYFQEPFDWEESDRLITAVSQHNLHLIPLLDGNPDNQFAPPQSKTAYAAWVGDFARRYQTQISAYIIWDEPNLTSHWGFQNVNPVEYAALLSASAETIRKNDPTALIVAAPLAPTSEQGPQNLAEVDFLNSLYESGAANSFDIVAVKPYGFDSDATDRRLDNGVLNFSRPILIRELMIAHGEGHKAIWAGNWGWNSLPDEWNGRLSIWGATTEEERGKQTVAALNRAQTEWPWMGIMFLENWEPEAAPNDPVWGFSIAGQKSSQTIRTALANQSSTIAQSGFHLAHPDGKGQSFVGNWEFSPEFGADSSEPINDQLGDKVTFTFWGTDLGLRVRRANYRARLYVTIDGEPANGLPRDEFGTNLILTAPSPEIDEIVVEPVATNLTPGIHTAEVVASRGWDQWALHGFSVGYQPAQNQFISPLNLIGFLLLGLGLFFTFQIEWRQMRPPFGNWFEQLATHKQVLLVGITAVVVSLSGWLTWGEQASGIYRRLGDTSQITLTAAAATLFYVTPTLYIYTIALGALFLLIYFRPSWGLALVALCFPLYVPPLTKPILNFRFSPTEIFMLLTFTAVILRTYTQKLQQVKKQQRPLFSKPALLGVDWAVLLFTAVATLSLFFTDRLDVATNEWRVVIIEPVLFYSAMRLIKPTKQELWFIFEAFLCGGFIVAGYGLWQYISGSNELITAEGGLLRIRSFYGSPNNVGLYLGRILPILAALILLGPSSLKRRKWVYGALFSLMAVVLLLTFSRGAIILGVPAAFVFIFWQWQRQNGRLTWPWIIVGGITAVLGLIILLQVPQLAGRFNLRGQTSFFRLALWQASWQMFLDHPWLGVGLDNFLYAYRSEYILNAAWQEPDLNHPHNIFLDFATRLGLLGMLAGGLLFFYLARYLKKGIQTLKGKHFALLIGMAGALIDIMLHGLVDHSFFLVDLAFIFMWLLATAVSLGIFGIINKPSIRKCL